MKGFPYNIGCKPKVGLRAPLTMTFTIHIHYLLIFRMRRFLHPLPDYTAPLGVYAKGQSGLRQAK